MQRYHELMDGLRKRSTPQTQKADPRQRKNAAGGYTFVVSPLVQVERFLILGSAVGSAYVSAPKLTKQNVEAITKALGADPAKTLQLIYDVSVQGRAQSNDPALFALAVAASFKPSVQVRKAALAALSDVARTPTHLFHFLTYVQEMRGWGRLLKTAVQEWYVNKDVERLAYQMVKFQERDGWSNRDVLRKAKPAGVVGERAALFRWITTGEASVEAPQIVHAFEQAKTADEVDTCRLIRMYGLTREMIRTEHLKSAKVWEALLVKMPMTAMIRNLGNMTKVGLLKPLSEASKEVVERLNDEGYLKRARVHPVQVFMAKKIYDRGRGLKGGGSWNVDPNISAALEKAFYKCFNYVEPSGKNFLLGVDVSGSMTWSHTANGLLTCAEAAALMAMVQVRCEPNTYVKGFCDRFVDLGIGPNDTFETVCRKVQKNNFGGTDCSLPMRYAIENRLDVDTFVVYTDNGTWAGKRGHPHQVLNEYRRKMNKPNAKLIVVAFVANRNTIADPSDPFMLDLTGFDTNTPAVISEFAKL